MSNAAATTLQHPRVDLKSDVLRRDPVLIMLSGALWSSAHPAVFFLGSLYLLRTSDSVAMTQLLQVTMFIPVALISISMGRMADRSANLTRTSLLAYVGIVACLIVLAGALFLTQVPQLIYGATILVGVSMVVTQVPRRRVLTASLQDANNTGAVLVIDTIVFFFFGAVIPVTLGAIAFQAGLGIAFGSLGAVLAIATLLLLGVRTKADTRRPHTSAKSTTDAPFRLPPLTVGVLLVTILLNIVVFPYLAMITPMAHNLGASDSATGLAVGMSSFGMLFAGLILGAFGWRARRWRVFCVGSLLGVMSVLFMGLIPNLGYLTLMVFLAGMGGAIFAALQPALGIRDVAEHHQGRVLGLLVTAIGILPPGSLQFGFLSDLYGISAVMIAEGTIGVFILIAIWAVCTIRMKRSRTVETSIPIHP